jgi:hypothetical protein
MILSYIHALNSTNPTTPIITDENSALSIMSSYVWQEIESFATLQTGDFPGVFLYGIPEEKQHVDIVTVRKCIADTSLRPYEGKNIVVFRDFDTATLEAQNAMLKLLEDGPDYLAIILIVQNPENLIGTIHSRVISLFQPRSSYHLSRDLAEFIHDFFHENSDKLVQYLFVASYSREEAIAMIVYASKIAPPDRVSFYEQALEDIFTLNENPRNILDSLFIIPGSV